MISVTEPWMTEAAGGRLRGGRDARRVVTPVGPGGRLLARSPEIGGGGIRGSPRTVCVAEAASAKAGGWAEPLTVAGRREARARYGKAGSRGDAARAGGRGCRHAGQTAAWRTLRTARRVFVFRAGGGLVAAEEGGRGRPVPGSVEPCSAAAPGVGAVQPVGVIASGRLPRAPP